MAQQHCHYCQASTLMLSDMPKTIRITSGETISPRFYDPIMGCMKSHASKYRPRIQLQKLIPLQQLTSANHCSPPPRSKNTDQWSVDPLDNWSGSLYYTTLMRHGIEMRRVNKVIYLWSITANGMNMCGRHTRNLYRPIVYASGCECCTYMLVHGYV